MSQLQVDETTLDVTELPVRMWTQDYKDFLEGLIRRRPGYFHSSWIHH